MIPGLERVVASLPRRALSGRYWHQGPTRRQLAGVANPTVTGGRDHAVGGLGTWYASSQEQAAWAELLRGARCRVRQEVAGGNFTCSAWARSAWRSAGRMKPAEIARSRLARNSARYLALVW